jgi:hypothetical protein
MKWNLPIVMLWLAAGPAPAVMYTTPFALEGTDEEGVGGDDCADCLRYVVATNLRTISERKLRGL